MINVYLTNLAKYNEGELIGKWIELPMDSDELQAEIDEVLGEDEEYFITDYENDFGIRVEEYTNIHRLNEQAEKLSEIVKYNSEEVIKAAIDNYGSLEEAFEKLEEGDFSVLFDVDDEEDLGYAMVDEGYFGIEVPDALRNYLDYETIGREATHSGWAIYEDLNIAICWY